MIRPALVLAALAPPLAAEPWACGFTVECIAGESCEATAYDMEVIAADHEGQLFFSSLTADTPVAWHTQTRDGRSIYSGPSQLLTILTDGSATLSVHARGEGITALSYFGTCEVLE